MPSCRYAKQPAVSQKKYEDLRRHTAKLEQYVSAAKDINLSSLLTLDEKLELYDLHEGKYSSKILCEVLGISRGTYSKRIANHKKSLSVATVKPNRFSLIASPFRRDRRSALSAALVLRPDKNCIRRRDGNR